MPEMRLIDANALIGCKNGVRRVVELTDGGMFGMVYPAVSLMDIKDAPTIEAAPVVHGRWEKSDIPHEKYCCSACGGACWYYDYEGEVARSRYCPNCGAKMDGGSEG